MNRLALAVVAMLAAGAESGVAMGADLGAGETRDPLLLTTAQVMEGAQPSDWRRPDPANLIYLDFAAGRVLIDGCDARRLHLDDLRRNIGLVFQESFLFSNTIGANIAFGHPQATREQIERAARIAAAHDFITALPNGYDTVLGESGSTLSGGQRQRLAIARAVLLEPAILLLDDPTAAIDSETEHEIFEALDRAIAGRTTFIVAHRLSTLRRADFIIVLDDGRIVQRGTHEQLMREPGPYLRVASLQLIDSRDLQPVAEGGAA